MEISDSVAFQSYLRTRATLTGDAGVRILDAWREISAVSWRLARLHTEACGHMARELLACTDVLQPSVIVARQVHPTVVRINAWQERVLDLLGGAQAELAASAEAYLPVARYAAAPLAD